MPQIDIRHPPAEPTSQANAAPAGHNGGPPLDEHTPEWGNGGVGNYFHWKAAHRAAWKTPSPGIVAFRIRKAERLGLTYEEYTLEILAAVTCRSRTSNGLQRSNRRAPPVQPAIESEPAQTHLIRLEPIIHA